MNNNILLSFFATFKRPLLVLLVSIAPVMTQYAHAGTLGGSTSWGGAWGWTFSNEILQFTRANITLEDGTIIAAPTFDITEDADCYVDQDNPPIERTINCTGSVLFKGILKVTHFPEPGEAWVEVQIRWPNLDIEITQQPVVAEKIEDETTTSFTFLEESRVYEVKLNGDPGVPASNTTKLTDGFKMVAPYLPRDGVYLDCTEDYIRDPEADVTAADTLCYQEIGYGDVDIDPFKIFQEITSASGQTVDPNIGLYWDEACTAFPPGVLDIKTSKGDFILSEDEDGYFRLCEGRSVAFNVCTNRDNDPDTDFDCNYQNNGQYLTLVLADAAAGDRLEPAPTTVCIGTEVADWLALAAYADSGEDLVITPCDPNQDFMQLPYYFTDSSIWFTSSEGDNTQIDNLQIALIATRSETGTTLILQESPDKTASFYDFSNLQLNNVLSIQSLELDDTVTGTAGTDVLLGGNGNDRLFGFEGDDCVDGQKNDDQLWGDSHWINNDSDTTNDRDVAPGEDVFVLTDQLGKDTIEDFDGSEGDVIVNVSRTTATVTDNGDSDPSTFRVELKGQNYVIVHVADDGGTFAYDPDTGTSTDVINQSRLSDGEDYTQCSGHPAY